MATLFLTNAYTYELSLPLPMPMFGFFATVEPGTIFESSTHLFSEMLPASVTVVAGASGSVVGCVMLPMVNVFVTLFDTVSQASTPATAAAAKQAARTAMTAILFLLVVVSTWSSFQGMAASWRDR